MLMQDELPSLAVASVEDQEAGVRACALQCLQEMVQSCVLWKECLEKQQLPVSRATKCFR